MKITDYKGSCRCHRWRIKIEVQRPLDEFNPRVCDCDFCQQNPSEIISDPNMVINCLGGEVEILQNGDELANFYYCNHCGDFLAVGCNLNGELRGAVNSNLLQSASNLGDRIRIQPRLLSPNEKLERWAQLWGALKGL